jgi:chloride channel 3/4/5
VLLVTKAVGDLLGVKGIAEESIRFNGYPYLENNDHVYDAPGKLLLVLRNLK